MKGIVLACPTLKREMLAAWQKEDSSLPIYFLPARLHNDLQEMHSYLQHTIDSLANVDRIYLCTTGCGGSTVGIVANTAEIILPRTRDCLDILLSKEKLKKLERDIRGFYYTASWMDFCKNSSIDLEHLTNKMGRMEAEKYLRKLYAKCKDYYIIDTGCYDLAPVKAYVEPLVQIVQGNLHYVKGEYNILRKMAREEIDEDFYRVPMGGKIPSGIFFPKL